MTAASDRRGIVYQYHERIYRLAQLVGGEAGAAQLVEQAYRALPAGAPDAEAELTRLLLPRRRSLWRWSWRTTPAQLERAALDQGRADALIGVLAAMTPVERLSVGLHMIGGHTPEEIAIVLGDQPNRVAPAETLARFRRDAARATALVPEDTPDESLAKLDRWMEGLLPDDEVLELRRALLDQPEQRALRDGMIAARALLARAIPALFAATPPLALTERLLDQAQARERARRPRAHRAQGLLALAVLLIATAIIAGPSLLARTAATPLAQAPAASELIEAAIHRFDRAPLQSGVLHEQYRVARGDRPAYLIERWYDYAAPHRLAVTVTIDGANGPPLAQIGTDGRSLVQYRYRQRGPAQRRSLDAHVSEAEAQAVLPLLRGQPAATTFGRNADDYIDIGPLYLAQARAAGASFLGQAEQLGRPAFLLAYRTTQPPLAQSPLPDGQTAQVVLTIDAQTSALLDIAVLAGGGAESAAQHPLQAQQFEVQASVPDSRFQLATSARVAQGTSLASVRVPSIDPSQLITLEDAAQRAPQPLLAPQQLPDTNMRALAVALQSSEASNEIALLYEGEFQSVAVLPAAWFSNGVPNAANSSEERSAGDFRYRVMGARPDGGQNAELSAVVYRPEAPEQAVLLTLSDEYATTDEREATLQAMIASLTPVTEQSLPALRRNFYAPGGLDGKG